MASLLERRYMILHPAFLRRVSSHAGLDTPPPGPIQNRPLFANGQVNPNLHLHVDFFLVSSAQWMSLFHVYGGGPCIREDNLEGLEYLRLLGDIHLWIRYHVLDCCCSRNQLTFPISTNQEYEEANEDLDWGSEPESLNPAERIADEIHWSMAMGLGYPPFLDGDDPAFDDEEEEPSFQVLSDAGLERDDGVSPLPTFLDALPSPLRDSMSRPMSPAALEASNQLHQEILRLQRGHIERATRMQRERLARSPPLEFTHTSTVSSPDGISPLSVSTVATPLVASPTRSESGRRRPPQNGGSYLTAAPRRTWRNPTDTVTFEEPLDEEVREWFEQAQDESMQW